MLVSKGISLLGSFLGIAIWWCVVYVLAEHYDRKGHFWAVVSLLITPFMAIIILILIKSPYDDFQTLNKCMVDKDDSCNKFCYKKKFYDQDLFKFYKMQDLMEQDLNTLEKEYSRLSFLLQENPNKKDNQYKIVLLNLYVVAIKAKKAS